jgi:hypothetical protein
MKNRFLGIALIISAVIVILNGFRTPNRTGQEIDSLTHAVYFLWGIGGICGVLGLIRTNALGSNAVARTLGFLPLLGFASFVLADGLYLLGLFDGTEPLFNTLVGIGWVGMMVGMLVVGILTIAARAWTGWRRFVPLSTVIMIPLAAAITILGIAPLGDLLVFGAWILLGAVIATSERVTYLSPGITY